MKYNQVRIGDGVIANEKNVVIHSLGTLDWNIYDCISNTGLVVKKIQNDEKSSLLALKIITSDDNKDYKNSVITSWKTTEKRLNNYLRNKDVIYKKA